MASKLDELMALARECGNIERRHCIGKAQGFDVRDAYAALQDALKAVVEDAERYRWLKGEVDGTGPLALCEDMGISGRNSGGRWSPIPDYCDAYIDAARKP